MTEHAASVLAQLRDEIVDDARFSIEIVLYRIGDQHLVCDIANDFEPSGFDIDCQFTTLALLDRCWNITDIEGLPVAMWSVFRAAVDALKPS